MCVVGGGGGGGGTLDRLGSFWLKHHFHFNCVAQKVIFLT